MEEVPGLAFPEATRTEIRNIFLSGTERQRIEEAAGTALESDMLSVHLGWQGDRLLGYAMLDTHMVRTLPEAFLVVIDTAGRIERTHILAFYEPLEYLPRERWFRQFLGVSRNNDLRLGWDIHGISGATLSARAATASVRRFLATYEVLIAPSETKAAETSSRPDGATKVE